MNRRTITSVVLAALAALMAFAGTASATALTSPEGTTYTGSIAATSTNSELEGAFVTVKCGHSEASGEVGGHGAGINAGVTLSSLTLSSCNYTTHVIKPGSLEVDSSNNMISTGMEISIATSIGTCIISTNGTSVGNLTEGTNPTWHLNSAKIPRTGGHFLCGSSMTWTGSYSFTKPSPLWVD